MLSFGGTSYIRLNDRIGRWCNNIPVRNHLICVHHEELEQRDRRDKPEFSTTKLFDLSGFPEGRQPD
jgi:hypothetical protein